MIQEYTWFYAVMALVFLAVWAVIFLLKPRSRIAMFWTGFIFAPAAPISELWHLRDYWRPGYIVPLTIGRLRFGGLEDFVFNFALAGISAALFDALTPRPERRGPTRPSLQAVIRMEGLGAIGLGLMAALSGLLKLRSVHAMILAVALTASLVLALRPEVVPTALLSAVLFASLSWLCYTAIMLPLFPGAFDVIWLPHGNLGIRIGTVPVEEVVWSFVTALFTGPVYRACTTQRKARSASTLGWLKIVSRGFPENPA